MVDNKKVVLIHNMLVSELQYEQIDSLLTLNKDEMEILYFLLQNTMNVERDPRFEVTI